VKRGFGGIVDVEFLVECLKLVHGHGTPALRCPGTLSALGAARREGLLGAREHEVLLTAVQFLRTVESRMRIVYDMAGDRIPDSPEERDRLARRLGYADTDASPAGDALLEEYAYHTTRTREIFEAVLERASTGAR
jgi:glutamate-ammonia-ligase adenylyltransferase